MSPAGVLHPRAAVAGVGHRFPGSAALRRTEAGVSGLALGMGRDPAQTPIQPYLIK